MAVTDIRKALLSAIQDILENTLSVPVADIAWENVRFDHIGKPIWFRVTYTQNTPTLASIGEGGLDRTTGFVQIDMSIAVGGGYGAFDTYEDGLRAAFPAGQVVTESGQEVIITQAGIDGVGRIIDNLYRKSFTIFFYADTNRAAI